MNNEIKEKFIFYKNIIKAANDISEDLRNKYL